jgi:hypothetical protein
MLEAQKIFGSNCKLSRISCYQKQSKEKYETLFTEDFDVSDANTREIFEKLLEVVNKNKHAKFVVVQPLLLWTKHRDDILQIFEKENELVFKHVCC